MKVTELFRRALALVRARVRVLVPMEMDVVPCVPMDGVFRAGVLCARALRSVC